MTPDGPPAQGTMTGRRRLGRTPLLVPRLSLGCVTFGREIDEAASFDLLDHATAMGMTLLDTAEAYGGGQARAARERSLGRADVREATGEFHSSELIIGRWLAARPNHRRTDVLLQSKVTPPLTPARILESLDASLRRLRTDYLDACLLHAYDPNTPIDDSLGALGEAVRLGKARVVGCSNFAAPQLADALQRSAAGGLPRLEVAQFNYNLAVRDAEADLLPLCADANLGVQTYSPLGAGFLTGKYDPATRAAPPGSRFDVVPGHANQYFHPAKFHVVRRLADLSARTGVPTARLAVAWVLKDSRVDTVLIGARTRAHVDSALAASRIAFPPEWDDALRPMRQT